MKAVLSREELGKQGSRCFIREGLCSSHVPRDPLSQNVAEARPALFYNRLPPLFEEDHDFVNT